MKTLKIFFFLFLISQIQLFSQESDTIPANDNHIDTYKSIVIPLSLISAGLIINKSQFERDVNSDMRDAVGKDYHFAIDDYLIHAPILEILIADIAGAKSKNHWFDQSKFLLFSNLLSSGTTLALKKITHKSRPEGAHDSFPSGHTTGAFTNASVLFNEFNETEPLLAYSGFVFATTTGTFRMLNNKHWLSDVLVGAGIGIISTEIIYYFEPLKSFNPFKESENFSFAPIIDSREYGVDFTYKF